MTMLIERTLGQPTRIRPSETHQGQTPVAVIMDDGSRFDLTDELSEPFAQVIEILGRGSLVDVRAISPILSTQEAADFLGISRPTLVRYLDEGRLPYSQPGTHRRLKHDDVLAFKEAMQNDRRMALAEISRLATADGLRADPFVTTR